MVPFHVQQLQSMHAKKVARDLERRRNAEVACTLDGLMAEIQRGGEPKELRKAMVRHKGDLNRCTKGWATPLIYATYCNNIDAVAVLITEGGADPDQVSLQCSYMYILSDNPNRRTTRGIGDDRCAEAITLDPFNVHRYPDGLKTDDRGNLFVATAEGVHIYSPEADLLAKILTPKPTSNIAFGGPDGNTLFIRSTATDSEWAAELSTRGAGQIFATTAQRAKLKAEKEHRTHQGATPLFLALGTPL